MHVDTWVSTFSVAAALFFPGYANARTVRSIELVPRDDSPTTVCKRWAQQSVIVNGTLYLYGGEATTDPDQTSNQWNNNFLTLDLTKTWQIASPLLSGLPRPSGPPAVSEGSLWASYDSLFLYGGEFSYTPPVAPPPFSLWEYDIGSSTWLEHSNPLTSSGVNAPNSGVQVQRAAEGAGFSLKSLGRGWYFGGHQDGYTTPGWSQSIPRIYLQSLLEYTFPGTSNSELSSTDSTGEDGAWRNITNGGTQGTAEFPERADGVLVYVPGFSKQGILIGLAGGTNQSFTQLNVIDVFDIATSTWYKQATTGPTPSIRVNPCAVVAAAADGSSYNVYMYGGQNLVPYEQQVQYSDIWILSIPSFIWIKVPTDSLSNPAARAGHTCNMWDAQMVVVGGYVSKDLSCDTPGIYVFDLSSLKWVPQFTSRSSISDNPESKQLSQMKDILALEGTYGYQVPDLVQSAIGGGPTGGATVTAPVATATLGPLATGAAETYTVSGAITTATGSAGSGGSGGSGSSDNGGPNVGAIVGGVLAGVFGVLALYLGFCAWLYRRRLKMHQHHAEIARRHEQALQEEKNRPSTQRRGPGHHSPNLDSSQSLVGGFITGKSSTDDLLRGQEPTFVGIFMHPRKSLRVVNA